MNYKHNADDAIKRLSMLFSNEGKASIFAKFNIQSNALNEYKASFSKENVDYPALSKRAYFWNKYTKESAEVTDDSFPLAYMSEFDEGIYGALLGAEIRFLDNKDWGWVSSMSVPFIETAEQLLQLSVDKQGKWAQILTKQLEFFKKEAAQNYGISHFILIDGLNLLLELRGATNMYYDCLEHEDIIKEFIIFARELNYYVQDKYFDIIGLYKQGTISNMGQYIPGKIVSESLDPFHMASPDFFYQWGFENIEEIFSHYDGGVVHIHSGNGQHLIPHASKLKGLKMIALIDEEWNEFKSFHRLDEINKERGDIPIKISMPIHVFKEKLEEHTLPGNVFYDVTGVENIHEANLLMEKVLKYQI